MNRKLILVCLIFCVSLNASGCIALLAAGAAVGAVGAASWLQGKLTQEFNAGFDRTIDGAKKALKTLKLPLVKETRKADVAQLISSYYDNRMVWIDVHKVSDSLCRVEVRVGATGEEAPARRIMDRIRRYVR